MIAALTGVAALSYALDQGSKAWALSSLDWGRSRPLLGEILQLRLTSNPGAAFSIATNATWLLTAIAVVVVIATLVVARHLRSWLWAVALGLLIGGALGNLTDRFLREPGGGQGHVIDFLQLPHWPIFNIADMSIVAAAVVITLLAWRGIRVDGSRTAQDAADLDPTTRVGNAGVND